VPDSPFDDYLDLVEAARELGKSNYDPRPGRKPIRRLL
jgi:hypothetical protein